jgi:hypothetical protein
MADIEAATDVDHDRLVDASDGDHGRQLRRLPGVVDLLAHRPLRRVVSHAGVYNTQAQYAATSHQGRHKAFGGEPWDDLEAIDRESTRYSGCYRQRSSSMARTTIAFPSTRASVLQRAPGVPARLVARTKTAAC